MSVSVFVNGNQTVVADLILPGTITNIGNVLNIYTGSNWLPCDGSAQLRATYAQLFTAIGVTFGQGDGVTTFNLPTRAQAKNRSSIYLTAGKTFDQFQDDADIVINNPAAAVLDISAGALNPGIRISIIEKSTLGVTLYLNTDHSWNCLLPQGTYLLEWDGTQWALLSKTAKIRVLHTTSTTWKVPFSAACQIFAIGGGGGGGVGTSSTSAVGGGGGGGGAGVVYMSKNLLAGASIDILVGAAGSAGVGTGASGGAGGTTTVTDSVDTLIAPGGAGGGGGTNSLGSGGAGGTRLGGPFQFSVSGVSGNAATTTASGAGGDSGLVVGQGGNSVSNSNGVAGAALGGGGSGGHRPSSGSTRNGGAGGTGGVIIEF